MPKRDIPKTGPGSDDAPGDVTAPAPATNTSPLGGNLTRSGGEPPKMAAPAPADTEAAPVAGETDEPAELEPWRPTVRGIERPAEEGPWPNAPLGLVAIARMAGFRPTGVSVLFSGRQQTAVFPPGFDVYHVDEFTAAAATAEQPDGRRLFKVVTGAGPTTLRSDAGEGE